MGRSMSGRVWFAAALGALLWTSPVLARQDGAAAGQEHASASSNAPSTPTTAAQPHKVGDRLLLPASAGALLAPINTPLDATEARVAAEAAAPTVVMRRQRGTGTALAIAGGALFVAGLLAGDDAGAVMMLAGAGVGAYGLYLMLR